MESNTSVQKRRYSQLQKFLTCTCPTPPRAPKKKCEHAKTRSLTAVKEWRLPQPPPGGHLRLLALIRITAYQKEKIRITAHLT